MISFQRHREIVEYVNRHRLCRTRELAQHFGVSVETIRRDLHILAEQGKLKKVHGGAASMDYATLEVPFEARRQHNLQEKRRIGRLAATLIRDGESLAMDTGSTVLEVARHLQARRLTVFTFSIPVALELIRKPQIDVYLLAGKLRGDELSVSGPLAEETVKGFNFDWAILGAGGISPARGVTDYHMEEASLRREMVRRARRVMLVADYSKFGVLALNRVLDISDIDVLVTDARAPHDDLDAIRAANVQVLQAGVDDGEG